jgi:hypothetical protein
MVTLIFDPPSANDTDQRWVDNRKPSELSIGHSGTIRLNKISYGNHAVFIC